MGRHLLIGIGLLATGVASSAAASAPVEERTTVRFAGGDCDRLLVAGRAASRGCKPKLVTMLYRSGLVSFAFSLGDGRVVSFLGRVQRQVGQQTSLSISQVTMVTRGGGKAFAAEAKGRCVLTPFAVNRSRLECSARAGSARYAALFRTRDEEPVLVSL